MLTDSHAHLDTKDFKIDLDDVIKRAQQEGIGSIITVGVDLKSSNDALNIAKRYPGIYTAVGFHPHNAAKVTKNEIQTLIDMAEDPKVIAWGEIGLDFFKSYSPRQKQMRVFEEQLKIASDLNIPVIIHDRDAHTYIVDVLSKYNVIGLIHCFSGDLELANVFAEMGFYISIPGTVTYKKATKIRKVVANIPLNYMVIETDSPFLTPYQKRGQRNEPSFVKFVAQEIALIKGINVDEVAKVTTNNIRRLFNI